MDFWNMNCFYLSHTIFPILNNFKKNDGREKKNLSHKKTLLLFYIEKSYFSIK